MAVKMLRSARGSLQLIRDLVQLQWHDLMVDIGYNIIETYKTIEIL